MRLRTAFLWHQHQPYYKQGGHYLLPWSRLHGTKDYYDIAAALEGFPRLRQTINVAPSLLVQLQDYVEGNATDRALDLTRIPAADLSADEKVEILRSFFLCNVDRMILPYPRFAELYGRGHRQRDDISGLNAAAQSFSVQDWLDLQVWYNLTWVGEYSRAEEPFASLLAKGQGYSEKDKEMLLAGMRELLAKVIPTYRRLLESGQVELSVTPFYHPILPILCDSNSALEAMPDVRLPEHHISYPEDARLQIARGIESFTGQFGARPFGMWPSEGSVSTAATALMAEAGLEWAASDEGILHHTLGERRHPLAKYFPYRLHTANGPLWMVFRDHQLSDSIGFVYSNWAPETAARDFYNRLIEIRTRILQELGPEELEHALVSVILDGENCWEYYEHNGRPFLEALYRLLSESEEIETTTIHNALATARESEQRSLDRIFAGSWVGSNFKIWIGHDEDNEAWDALATARQLLMQARPTLDVAVFDEAMEHIYIAEGSDWFWWYGDENSAVNQDDFDTLFRSHIIAVYELMGLAAPAALSRSIRRAARTPQMTPPIGTIRPALSGDAAQQDGWNAAGSLRLESVGGTMHRAESRERFIRFGSDGEIVYLRLSLAEPLQEHGEIHLTVSANRSVMLRCTHDVVAAELPAASGAAGFDGLRMVMGTVMDAMIPLRLLAEDNAPVQAIGVVYEIFENGHPVERIPQHGMFACPLGPVG